MVTFLCLLGGICLLMIAVGVCAFAALYYLSHRSGQPLVVHVPNPTRDQRVVEALLHTIGVVDEGPVEPDLYHCIEPWDDTPHQFTTP